MEEEQTAVNRNVEKFRVILKEKNHSSYPQRCKIKNAFWDIHDEDYEPSDFTHGKVMRQSGKSGCDPAMIDASNVFDFT
jgi:hypothetical protein